jgi:hypothetical protein
LQILKKNGWSEFKFKKKQIKTMEGFVSKQSEVLQIKATWFSLVQVRLEPLLLLLFLRLDDTRNDLHGIVIAAPTVQRQVLLEINLIHNEGFEGDFGGLWGESAVIHRDVPSLCLYVVVENDLAGVEGKEGVVFAQADSLTRVPLGASLTEDDVAGLHSGSVVFLESQIFSIFHYLVVRGSIELKMMSMGPHGTYGCEVRPLRDEPPDFLVAVRICVHA